MDFNDSEVVDLLGRLSNAKSPSGFEDETIEVVRDFCSTCYWRDISRAQAERSLGMEG